MRSFRVTVNGLPYEVTVEELGPEEVAEAPEGGGGEAGALPSAPRPGTAPARREGEGRVVRAPLPGAVLAVKVVPGEAVVEGQVLCLLEAMKMENEIVAPAGGVVQAVHVEPGQSVTAGEPLVTLGG
jgi:biotin carboxyl carrier protein